MPLFSHAQDIPVPKEIVVKVIKNLAEQHGLNSTTLLAISYCESRFTTETGLNKKDDKVWSKDYGYFQLNDFYHRDEANSLGYDIEDPWENILYGIYLFKKEGLAPWKASKKCISNYAGQGMT